jgi:uncharacterized membrane protein
MKKKQSIKTKLFDKMSITFGIIYGLILGTTFSIIDNLLFLIAEEHITTFLERSIHNRNIIGLIESSFSAAIAFFIASFLEKKVHSKYPQVCKHPSIDFVGILLGGFIVAFVYYIIIRHKSDT